MKKMKDFSMRDFKKAAIPAVVCLKIVLAVVFWATMAKAAAPKETTYDRVMRTKTLRCGYIDYPPHMIIDPATKVKSGIMHDIVEEAAKLLELKVEWTEEIGWANTVTTLNSGRVDAICTSFWQNPVEGRYVGFTMPLFYSAVNAYVRADDNRFTGHPEKMDDPAVSVSASDGAEAMFIAQQNYPKAKIVSLPNMTDESQLLLEVATKKADVTFVEAYLGQKFIKNNPGKLKNITAQEPVRLFGNTMAIPQDDVKFKSMLDSALVQMLYGGEVDKIIKKYEEVPGGIYRVAKPYEVPK